MKETFIKIAVGIIVVLFTCLMLYNIWQESNSPKMELNKPEWKCVKTETRITNLLIGGKLMPQSRQECIEYKRQ